MRFIQLVRFTVIATLFFNSNVFAQESDSVNPAPKGHAFSFHMGPILPDTTVEATQEILRGIGFRYAMPFRGRSLLEAGYTTSHSEGANYTDGSLSLRVDTPFQDMYAFGLLGANVVRIKGPLVPEYKNYIGGHIGGGFLAHVADTLFFRTEMRFNFEPGMILFFGFGFEYRFGEGGGGN